MLEITLYCKGKDKGTYFGYAFYPVNDTDCKTYAIVGVNGVTMYADVLDFHIKLLEGTYTA